MTLFEHTAHLGTKIIGIVVTHRGRTMTLQPCGRGWEAITLAEPEGVEEHDVTGYGATPEDALDACADEAEIIEDEDN